MIATVCGSGIKQHLNYALARVAITKRIMGMGHGTIMITVLEQPDCLCYNSLSIGTDEPRRPRENSLRSLGSFPHNQYWLAERGCLLLDAAGIGKDKMGQG